MTNLQDAYLARREARGWLRARRPDLAALAICEAERHLIEAEQERLFRASANPAFLWPKPRSGETMRLGELVDSG